MASGAVQREAERLRNNFIYGKEGHLLPIARRQDAASDYALSYVGNDSIKELLKDGIKGGMEEYTASGSIKSALEGAQKSVSDGIECQIADAPLETAGAAVQSVEPVESPDASEAEGN